MIDNHSMVMSDSETSGDVENVEENRVELQEIDDDDDNEEEESEDEETRRDCCTSGQDSSSVRVSLFHHEQTNAMLECLTNIEIPYRCVYMSCGNFYSRKSDMLRHMRCDHGVDINLIPSVHAAVDTDGGAVVYSSMSSPANSVSDTKNPVDEVPVNVSTNVLHCPQQQSAPKQVNGHVRHKCPYAQCFTCPHCFTCYSTPYRLRLHVQCSHRQVMQMNACTVQPVHRQQALCTVSGRHSRDTDCIPLMKMITSSTVKNNGKSDTIDQPNE